MVELILAWVAILGPLVIIAIAMDSSGSNFQLKSARFKDRYASRGSSVGGSHPPEEKAEIREKPSLDNLEGTIIALRQQIQRLKESGREIIKQRDSARAEIIRLNLENQKLHEYSKNKSGDTPTKSNDKSRVREIKAAFARLYHPDRITVSGFERTLREQVFKEFWSEIERIDRGI